MTAQVPDTYRYKGKQYSIIAMTDRIEFDPRDYGLEPESTCTACWRGYSVDYNIKHKKLLVEDLWISESESGYPDINGVKVRKLEKRGIFSYIYEDVNLPVNYTGKIVVGHGFMREYYIHMGFQRAWAYETVIELVFENGSVVEEIDHSDEARKIREDIEAKKFDPEESDIHYFVHKSFSLSLKDKAWWIE